MVPLRNDAVGSNRTGKVLVDKHKMEEVLKSLNKINFMGNVRENPTWTDVRTETQKTEFEEPPVGKVATESSKIFLMRKLAHVMEVQQKRRDVITCNKLKGAPNTKVRGELWENPGGGKTRRESRENQ